MQYINHVIVSTPKTFKLGTVNKMLTAQYAALLPSKLPYRPHTQH